MATKKKKAAAKVKNPPADLRKLLIEDMVKRLRDYGFPKCTADNVITDDIYRAFFRKSLRDTVDDPRCFPEMRKACKGLFDEMDIADGAKPKTKGK